MKTAARINLIAFFWLGALEGSKAALSVGAAPFLAQEKCPAIPPRQEKKPLKIAENPDPVAFSKAKPDAFSGKYQESAEPLLLYLLCGVYLIKVAVITLLLPDIDQRFVPSRLRLAFRPPFLIF